MSWRISAGYFARRDAVVCPKAGAMHGQDFTSQAIERHEHQTKGAVVAFSQLSLAREMGAGLEDQPRGRYQRFVSRQRSGRHLHGESVLY